MSEYTHHNRFAGSRFSRTSRVVTGGQQDASRCLLDSDDVTGSRCAQNAIVTDDQLLDAVCRTNFGNQLCDFWIPVASITADNEGRSFYSFRDGEEDAGNEGFAVVLLLEDLDLLSKSRTAIEISH